MLFALILATISPLFYGLMNVYDKYVVENRVKYYYGYAVLDASVLFIISFILGLFLDWKNIQFNAFITPIIIGICLSICFWIYYYLISKEDISSIIGILYLYPIIVAILSFFFLNEKIALIGYLGIILTIIGTIFLTTRLINIKTAIIGALFGFILFTAIGEFLVKVSVQQLPVLNSLVIVNLTTGIIVFIIGFFNTKIRSEFKKELHNYYLPIVGVAFWIIGEITLYYAMEDLPASIVSSLSSTQPLFILFLERFLDSILGYKITKDQRLLPKFGAIFLIVLGVILLYSSV